MTATMKPKITSSTGNVFRDLGFGREEAVHLLARADLMIQLQKLIASRRVKQKSDAKVLRVTQPRVSDRLRGRIGLFSMDALLDNRYGLVAGLYFSLMIRDEQG
jgi:predicted XRE-type DNA-binding protein